MALPISTLYTVCGNPKADATAMASWGTLNVDSATTAQISVGLFGYDMTCLATYCAVEDSNAVCDLIEARGLDGLAFGVNFKITKAGAGGRDYCAGFHRAESSDIAVCEEYKTNAMFSVTWS